MTLDRLVWDKLLQLDKEGNEVASMTLVLKDYNTGEVSCYGVDEYGSFYKVE